ncbi:MAG: RNA methyltransferase [Myxococcota bacterium]
MHAFPANLFVVCHQIRSLDNLGAIARVMANFGVSRLILSDPARYDFRGAEKLAVGAEEVLANMAVARDLDEALTDVVYALGSSSRERLKRQSVLAPDDAARRLAAQAQRGKVALVLGGEKRGLSDDELARCQDVVVIPTAPKQPSMNVSHAAAVLLYLITQAKKASPPSATPEPGAPQRLWQKLEETMKEALEGAGWLNPQAPRHALRELMRALQKGRLSQREAQMWLSAFEHLARATRRPARPS